MKCESVSDLFGTGNHSFMYKLIRFICLLLISLYVENLKINLNKFFSVPSAYNGFTTCLDHICRALRAKHFGKD